MICDWSSRGRYRRLIPMKGRARRVYDVISVVAILHLVIHILLRIHVWFHPLSRYSWVVNVFTASCYLPVYESDLQSPELAERLKSAQALFEHIDHQTLIEGSTVYASEQSPSRALNSFESGLLQPLLREALQSSDLDHDQVSVRDVIYQPYPGFGQLFYIIAEYNQGPKQLLKLSAFMPSSKVSLVQSQLISSSQQIEIIVPYSDSPKKLEQFIKFLLPLLRTDSNFRVTIVNFIAQSSHADTESNRLSIFISEILLAISGSDEHLKRFHVLSIRGGFSRGRGLNYGAAESKCSDCTLFFCDVDMMLTSHMLDKCRALASKGSSAYFPIVFSQFNPALSSYHVHNSNLHISQDSGFWRSFGYGMSCIHSSDFQRLEKLPEYSAWGGEDDAFHKSVQKSGLTVHRVPEPGLVHVYHPKDCSRRAATDINACYRTKAITEGNSKQLGSQYFTLQAQVAAANQH